MSQTDGPSTFVLCNAFPLNPKRFVVAASEMAMNDTLSIVTPVFSLLEYSLTTFNKIPGSAVVLRYIRSSHQNDPGRTLLEFFLLLFAIRTLMQSRTRADRNGSHFIQFTEKVSRQYPTPSVSQARTFEVILFRK
jgi:hypothetical protein